MCNLVNSYFLLTFSQMASIETNPFFFVQDGYCTPNTTLIPLSCGIVFGVAGWTTTMKVMDENHKISKMILTKHYF